jgi:hypothetical protein
MDSVRTKDLKGGMKFYHDFQKQMEYKKNMKLNLDDMMVCITIKLGPKSKSLLKNEQRGGGSYIDEKFLKTVEYEYACQYLTNVLKLVPKQKLIYQILKKFPLSNCEIVGHQSGVADSEDII